MRIHLYNAHKELWFGRPLKYWLYRRPWRAKYAFMLTQLMEEQGCVSIVTAPNPHHFFGGALAHKIKEYINVKIWALIHGHNPFRFACCFDPAAIKQGDFLIVIYIGNFTSFAGSVDSSRLVPYLNRVKGRIILNVNHYPYRVKTGAASLEKLKFSFFWAESDLRKNSAFFRHFFSAFAQKFIVTPFAVRDEFVCRKLPGERIARAVAIGSVSLDMGGDSDFTGYFGHGKLQPIRHAIYSGCYASRADIIESSVSHINEGGAARPVRGAPNLRTAVANWRHNVFVFGQKKYHAIRMVDLLNRYQLHIVGEEIVGMPGIGFAEGMMCGSVFVGIDDPMYTDLGMIPGYHYVAYKGDETDLANAVQNILDRPDELSHIARNGLRFAEENFRVKPVFKIFLSQLVT